MFCFLHSVKIFFLVIFYEIKKDPFNGFLHNKKGLFVQFLTLKKFSF
jgi:hypothetical protein